MNNKKLLLHSIGIVSLALVGTSAFAQSGQITKLFCHTVGSSAMEPLGDREGHSIAVGQLTCRVEGGPLDGGILTGSNINEWDKTNGVLLSGAGVTRKPGATAAYQITEGKTSVTMADGKATGFTASGKGRWTMATGTAAALKGKTYSYTAKSTGPGQIAFEVKTD